MANTHERVHRSILKAIAHRAMLERGLDPEFPEEALAELDHIAGPAMDASARDLRNLLWCSIDNDDSLDLDQLTVAEALPDGAVKVFVAIADVDALVKKGSAIDGHAQQNTTSVYTAAETFPMLPVKLSNDLTSLKFDSDRLAVVIEMVFAADGSRQSSDIYRAQVHNHAKLAYNSLSPWLEGTGPMPAGINPVNGLDESLRLQDRIAQKLKARRFERGALTSRRSKPGPYSRGTRSKAWKPAPRTGPRSS